MEPLRKIGGKSGKPVVSYDGGATWDYDNAPAPQAAPAPAGGAAIDLGGQRPAAPAQPAERRFSTAPGSFADNATQTAKELGQGLHEAARGVGSGLLMGWDDELADAMGADNAGGQKQEMAARSATRADRVGKLMPSANTAGEVTGSLIGAKGAGAATRDAPALARVAGSAATQGAVQGAGDAQEGGRLEGAAKGAAVGVALGQGGKLAAKAAGAVGRGVAKVLPESAVQNLQKYADNARVRAMGMNPGQVAREPGGVPRQAATARKYGVGKGFFTGRGKMEDQATAGLEKAGAGRAAIETGVNPTAVVDGNQVAAPLVARARQFQGAAIGDEAAAYTAKARELASVQRPGVPRAPTPMAEAAPPPAPAAGPVGATDPGGKQGRAERMRRLLRGQPQQRPGAFDPTVQDGPNAKLTSVPPAPPKKMGLGVAPPPEQPFNAPREMNLEQLREGRQHYSPQNWAADSAPVRRKKDFRNAYAEGENALIERELPGKGAKYKKLGQDMHGLIEAQDSLANAGGSGARLPAGKYDALRQVGRSGWAGNQKAKLQEALVPAARAVQGMGRGATKAAGKIAGVTGSEEAQVGGSVLTRRVASAIENAEYPEDEYYRQYMSNPDFRHSGR